MRSEQTQKTDMSKLHTCVCVRETGRKRAGESTCGCFYLTVLLLGLQHHNSVRMKLQINHPQLSYVVKYIMKVRVQLAFGGM